MSIPLVRGIANYDYIECYLCGVPIFMEVGRLKARREDHAEFYCVVGHRQVFTGDTPKDKEITALKQRLEWKESEAASERKRADRAQHRLTATKGVVTKIKKRVANGVCPCCNRSFQNLMAHMKTQHPQWDPEKEP